MVCYMYKNISMEKYIDKVAFFLYKPEDWFSSHVWSKDT